MPEFNSPDTLPPVECPLLLQLPEVAALAQRTKFVSDKNHNFEYELLEMVSGVFKGTGQTFTGRYPWTYP